MPSTAPRILVSNDDGIHAEGLQVLERIASKISKEVWVVAPEQEQSGASHSLSLHLPVRVREIEKKRFATSGTPTDCVLLGIQQLIPAKSKPQLVLSGINRGSNAADDITYSGTVAAAMEATVLGVPAIALSQLIADRKTIHWETGEVHAPKLIQSLLRAGWPKGTLININFPNVAPGKVKGVRICPQGKRRVSVGQAARRDLRGRPYFWLGGERDNTAEVPGTDVDLLHKGYITVTPLSLDMTDYPIMERLRESCCD